MKFVACSDLHLSDSAPRCRKNEPNWLDAQQRVFDQLSVICDDHDIKHIVFAGDFFDKPKVSQQMECFAMEMIDKFHDQQIKWFTIPGQHDLLWHNVDYVYHSSYGVLKKAGVIDDFVSLPLHFVDTTIAGNLYGNELNITADIQVVHELLWVNEPFPNAPVSGNATNYIKQNIANGFKPKLIISGDNHTPFEFTYKGQTILNCGAMQRNKADQIDFVPSVLIVDSKTFEYERVYLDISQDIFEIPETYVEINANAHNQYIKSLAEHTVEKISFPNALAIIYENEETSTAVKEIIALAMND